MHGQDGAPSRGREKTGTGQGTGTGRLGWGGVVGGGRQKRGGGGVKGDGQLTLVVKLDLPRLGLVRAGRGRLSGAAVDPDLPFQHRRGNAGELTHDIDRVRSRHGRALCGHKVRPRMPRRDCVRPLFLLGLGRRAGPRVGGAEASGRHLCDVRAALRGGQAARQRRGAHQGTPPHQAPARCRKPEHLFFLDGPRAPPKRYTDSQVIEKRRPGLPRYMYLCMLSISRLREICPRNP